MPVNYCRGSKSKSPSLLLSQSRRNNHSGLSASCLTQVHVIVSTLGLFSLSPPATRPRRHAGIIPRWPSFTSLWVHFYLFNYFCLGGRSTRQPDAPSSSSLILYSLIFFSRPEQRSVLSLSDSHEAQTPPEGPLL